MNPSLFRLSTLLCLCAALAFGLSACSSDDDDTDDNGPGGVVRVSGAIESSVTWTSNNTYLLESLVYVEDGAVLTIEPGTTILGEPGSALIVTTTGRINAQGTAERPIVMTSSRTPGSRQTGDWGGVALLGNAPINIPVGQLEGVDSAEDRARYGGNDDAHNCGTLRYVRIEFAGFELSPDNELNGLTLAGCGRTTVLEYIQVHRGDDDGIEFFGGSANIRYAVISHAADDGLDWDEGWTGKAQFIVITQISAVGDNGIEADNLADNNDATPRSNPTIYNMTMVGSNDPAAQQRGMLLRRGTAAYIANTIVTGFTNGIAIRDDATVANTGAGRLAIEHSIVYNTGGHSTNVEGFDINAWLAAQTGMIFDQNPELANPFNFGNPNLVPAASSPAVAGIAPPNDGFFDTSANYIGAFRPGATTTWMDGWTSFPEN